MSFENIRVSPPKWLLQTFANNRAYLVCKTNVLSNSPLRPLTELYINRLVDWKYLVLPIFFEFGCQKISDSFIDLVMIITNFIHYLVLFVANYVFNMKYEFRRTDKDRRKTNKHLVTWKKIVF